MTGFEYTAPVPPPPGTLLRDRDGDLWEVNDGQCMTLVEPAERMELHGWQAYYSVALAEYGPFTVVEEG